MELKPIPNAGAVATRAASMWAIYGAFVIDAGIKVLQYLQDNRDVKWQDAIMPIALIIIGAARLMQQRSLETATVQQLEQERLTRLALEKEATTPGPAITQADVQAIKREAAAAVKE